MCYASGHSALFLFELNTVVNSKREIRRWCKLWYVTGHGIATWDVTVGQRVSGKCTTKTGFDVPTFPTKTGLGSYTVCGKFLSHIAWQPLFLSIYKIQFSSGLLIQNSWLLQMSTAQHSFSAMWLIDNFCIAAKLSSCNNHFLSRKKTIGNSLGMWC